MPVLTPHGTAQLSVMAARGLTVEQMAARLGLSPAVVEAELRWLRLTAGKAPERGPGERYQVEVGIGAGGWLRRRELFELLGDARREVEQVRATGGEARVVRVADDGTRAVVG